MLLRALGHLFSEDLAVDLGTANTLVYVRAKGIVLDEPSVVAISHTDNSLLAVGEEAKAMLARAPGSIDVLRPPRHGVIADFDVTERMLNYFIRKVHRRRSLVHPRIVLTVPSEITQVEKRAVQDSARAAGAREVYLIEEPMAAAIGAGLPIEAPGAHMIVDIGGGTTEVAIMSLAGIVYGKSLRIAGDGINEAVTQHMRRTYNLLIGERQAEEVKVKLGSAAPVGTESVKMEVKGRDLIDGFPRGIVVTGDEIREALREPIGAIVAAIRTCLEQVPPELAADLVDTGITLAGGGALLPGLDRLLRQETALPITVSDDPLTCVVRGAGKLLDTLGPRDPRDAFAVNGRPRDRTLGGSRRVRHLHGMAGVARPHHPLRVGSARNLLAPEQSGRVEPAGLPCGHRGRPDGELGEGNHREP
jgi:rod shape-determining protein MreB